MIKIENTEVMGWAPAIRGMRNPKNSWNRIDSVKSSDGEFFVGDNDHTLMMSLSKGGSVHAKYKRMITVYADVTAPLYWWKEFDTYKVGTVVNSCSTMHKIHSKEFTLDDFSTEHLIPLYNRGMENIITLLNDARAEYLSTKDKTFWWQMIQLLPSSYNQKRTVMMNYEVLTNIYESRRGHKLDEWHRFRDWIETLPYSEIIIGEENE